MVSTKFYLDTRRTASGAGSPLKISITQNRKVAYITLDVRLTENQWDTTREKVINHADAFVLNTYINEEKQKVDSVLISLNREGVLNGLNATQIKQKVMDVINPVEEDEPEVPVSLFLPPLPHLHRSQEREHTRGIRAHAQPHKGIRGRGRPKHP